MIVGLEARRVLRFRARVSGHGYGGRPHDLHNARRRGHYLDPEPGSDNPELYIQTRCKMLYFAGRFATWKCRARLTLDVVSFEFGEILCRIWKKNFLRPWEDPRS